MRKERGKEAAYRGIFFIMLGKTRRGATVALPEGLEKEGVFQELKV